MILDVNTFNFKYHDKIYTSNCCVHRCGIWDLVLLEWLKCPRKKKNCFKDADNRVIKLNINNLFNYRLMKLKGTKFQLKVWNYLKKIPRGKVKTYSEVAKSIGKPLAVRAVANAIGKNPLAPQIPCHRVIRSDGSLGGYSGKGGIKTKRLLLKKEGITL